MQTTNTTNEMLSAGERERAEMRRYSIEHDEADNQYYILRDGSRLAYAYGCEAGQIIRTWYEYRAENTIDYQPQWLRDAVAVTPTPPDPEPEPDPEPPTRRKRQPRQQPRQSREAQRNARIHQAFLTLREVACRDGHANHRCFSVASTSDPTVHYRFTWDTDNDRVHCNCPHGTLSTRGECVHIAAMRRYIHGLHESERRAHDPAERAKRAEETRRVSSALLARDNRPFSQRFMA